MSHFIYMQGVDMFTVVQFSFASITNLPVGYRDILFSHKHAITAHRFCAAACENLHASDLFTVKVRRTNHLNRT